MAMFLTLLLVITSVAIVLGRVALGGWINHLSLASAVCGTVGALFAGGLIGSNPIQAATWFYIFSAWLLLYLASLTVLSIRGRAGRRTTETVEIKGWEQAYQCCHSSPGLILRSGSSARTGWQLFLLLGLQSVLLGASDDFDVGKLVFAAVYVLCLVSWLGRIFAQGFASHEPVIRWTIAVLGLALVSRVPGFFSGISTVDWMRDFLPLLHFSWILLGPFAFFGRKSLWRAYLLFVVADTLLTLAVTDQYLILRKFSDDGLGLTSYARATDAVVLFGTFMVAPMTGLPSARYRWGFGLLTAAFVSAVLLTGTRSHFGAILVGLVFYFWLTKPRQGETAGVGRRAVLGSGLLGVVAVSLALSTGLLNMQQVSKRMEETQSLDFGAMTQRVDESIVAWNGFRESPWFGQGLGYSIPIASWSIMASDTDLFMVHDFYLYVLLKFGMLGVPVFLGFLLSMVRSAVSTYRQAKHPFDRAFAAGLASLIVALLVESLTASRFQDRSATALLSLLMAMLLSIRREIAVSGCPEPGVAQAKIIGGSGIVPSPSLLAGTIPN